MGYLELIVFGYVVNFFCYISTLLLALVFGTIEALSTDPIHLMEKMKFMEISLARMRFIKKEMPAHKSVHGMELAFLFPYASLIETAKIFHLSFGVGVMTAMNIRMEERLTILEDKYSEWQEEQRHLDDEIE